MYPFQGEHFQSVREEAAAFIKHNLDHLDGIMLFSLFDESEIEKDIVQSKKASKFYNLHLTQDPSLAKKKQKPTKSIAEILGKDNSKSAKMSKLQSVLDTYKYCNRKMVYDCLNRLELRQHVPTPSNPEHRFNDLGLLLSGNKGLGKKTVFFSSDGDFFRILEGANFGSQVFEAGFAFEVSKKKRAILMDLKRWALLVVALVRQAEWHTHQNLGSFIEEFVKSKRGESNASLFASLKKKLSEQEEDNVELSKRGNMEFTNTNQTKEPPTLKDVLNLLSSSNQSISLDNECEVLSNLTKSGVTRNAHFQTQLADSD